MQLFKSGPDKYEALLSSLEEKRTLFHLLAAEVNRLRAVSRTPIEDQELQRLIEMGKRIGWEAFELYRQRNEYMEKHQPEVSKSATRDLQLLKNGEMSPDDAYGTHAGADHQFFQDVEKAHLKEA